MTPFMPNPDGQIAAQVWSDELAEIVGCTGISGWLSQLGPWLGFAADAFPPKSPMRFAEFENEEKGIRLMLHYPFWDRATSCDPENWTVHWFRCDAYRAPLPFGLDATRETPASARAKLCDDIADFPRLRTVTHYLEDARVVSVEFKPDYVGIAGVTMTRLGNPVKAEPRNGSRDGR